MDHGIVTGYLMFYKLVKNFNEKVHKNGEGYTDVTLINGLNYRLAHLDHFAHIADAIICHNLWMSYDDVNNKKYKEYGLMPLIVTNNPDNRLSLPKNSLQFMLCLLDTIEPVKRFTSEVMSAQEVLENISITTTNNPQGIVIAWTEKLRTQEKFYKWLGDIQELPKWMNITVKPCRHIGDDCCVKITFR